MWTFWYIWRLKTKFLRFQDENKYDAHRVRNFIVLPIFMFSIIFTWNCTPFWPKKLFFYLQNWPSYTFFPTLSMYTASPHIYLSLWDLMLACKIEFLKFWKFYFQVKRLWPLFATLWAIFWWHLCGHMPQIWPYGRNLTIYPHDHIAPKMGVYWKSNKNVVNWRRNDKY